MVKAAGRAFGIGREEPKPEEEKEEDEGDVKVQAKRALISRLQGPVTVGQVENTARQGARGTPAPGLRRLDAQEPTEDNKIPIIAEASPGEKVLELIPENAIVTMHVSITIRKPYEPPEGASPREAQEALRIEHMGGLGEPQDERQREATEGRRIRPPPPCRRTHQAQVEDHSGRVSQAEENRVRRGSRRARARDARG